LLLFAALFALLFYILVQERQYRIPKTELLSLARSWLGGAGGLLIEPPVVVQLAKSGLGRHHRGFLHRPSSTGSTRTGCWLVTAMDAMAIMMMMT